MRKAATAKIPVLKKSAPDLIPLALADVSSLHRGIKDTWSLANDSFERLERLFSAIEKLSPDKSIRTLANTGVYLVQDWANLVDSELEGAVEKAEAAITQLQGGAS